MQMKATTTKNNASSKNAAVSTLTVEEKMAIYNEIAIQKKENELQAREIAKENKKQRDEICAKMKENKEMIRKIQNENKELYAEWNRLMEPIRQLRNN